jgi:uncharacterized protein YkwD
MKVILVIVVLIVASLASLATLSTGAGSASNLADCTIQSVTSSHPMWHRIQDRRAASSLQRFEWSEQLAQSAAYMSRDIAARSNVRSETDSLGRNLRTRLDAFGFHGEYISETAYAVPAGAPVLNAYNLWAGNDIRMIRIIMSSTFTPPAYTHAGIGICSGLVADYYVMDVGIPAGVPASTPTPLPPTPTVVPTATPVPTPTPPPSGIDRLCAVYEDIVPGQDFTLSCDR